MPSLGVSSLDFDRIGNDAVLFSPSRLSSGNVALLSRERIALEIMIRDRHQIRAEARKILGQGSKAG
jgi:hypothetical protein